jgi:hypothetical protein
MLEPIAVATRRKAFLALAKRRTVPGSGSSRAHLQGRTVKQTMPDLQSILQPLSFVVVGAMAARLYMPERMTYDTDILILAADHARCIQQLSAAGARKLGDLSIGGSTWQLADGSALDVLVSDTKWAQDALGQAVISSTGLPTIALPYLVVMKLLASRAQDIADLTRMLGGAAPAMLDQVRAVVARYVPDAVEDVESMIVLGRMEYE